jgi:hypothetical protein
MTKSDVFGILIPLEFPIETTETSIAHPLIE